MPPFSFTIRKKLAARSGSDAGSGAPAPAPLGRLGTLVTPHGVIETPSFVVVGTKATVKALLPEQVKALGAQVTLANTYHLYLQPGEALVKRAGGLHYFMGWHGPMMTDSGGFQAFSLGAAFGKNFSKIIASVDEQGIGQEKKDDNDHRTRAQQAGVMVADEPVGPMARVTEEGVEFKSYLDGSMHFFTPEKAIGIEHDLGADMIFAFDECTSPNAPREYQREALERTHRWAARSLAEHERLGDVVPDPQSPAAAAGPYRQALFGIVQGGRFEDLRRESARDIGAMAFDGFGIGGSFVKEDMANAVRWVNSELPEGKPRHLLGVGEPGDLFDAVENGCDLFDCVAPTRIARNGTLYASDGRIHIENAAHREDFSPIDAECDCYTCAHFTRAYLSHLYRSKEIDANILGSIHNVRFVVRLVDQMRAAIAAGTFYDMKDRFMKRYYHA